MTLSNYLVYVVVASLTIASPGPGVVLSIANSIKYGPRSALPGIAGIALGMFFIAVLASSGIGALFRTSELAFTILRYLGVVYLFYLGVKLWRSKSIGLSVQLTGLGVSKPPTRNRFKEGLLITLTNPKPMIFFIALFPQFISTTDAYLPQFAILSITFCVLICGIHTGYAYFSKMASRYFVTENGHRTINRLSSLCFWGFAMGLALNK